MVVPTRVRRRVLPPIAVLTSIVAVYFGALTVYLTALLLWGDVHDGVWLTALVRVMWLVAVPVSGALAFRTLAVRRQRMSEAIVGAGLAMLVVAVPLLAWGIASISSFGSFD